MDAGYIACRTGDGVAYARRIRKGGLPILLLLDLVPADGGDGARLVRDVRRLAWRERAAAVLALNETTMAAAVARAGLRWERSSGLNLLVKGADEAETRTLAGQPFDLAFGHLDFF